MEILFAIGDVRIIHKIIIIITIIVSNVLVLKKALKQSSIQEMDVTTILQRFFCQKLSCMF